MPHRSNLELVPLGSAIDDLEACLGDLNEARSALLVRLHSGRIKGFADAAHGFYGGHELDLDGWPIPSDIWARVIEPTDGEWRRGDFTAPAELDPLFDVRRRKHASASPLHLIGVRVVGAHLQLMLEGLPGAKPAARIGIAAAEQKCADWMRELAKNDRDQSPRKSDLLKEAKGKFSGLSTRGFQRVWDTTAPAKWKRSGPKSKR